jgi:hypothetical protein
MLLIVMVEVSPHRQAKVTLAPCGGSLDTRHSFVTGRCVVLPDMGETARCGKVLALVGITQFPCIIEVCLVARVIDPTCRVEVVEEVADVRKEIVAAEDSLNEMSILLPSGTGMPGVVATVV